MARALHDRTAMPKHRHPAPSRARLRPGVTLALVLAWTSACADEPPPRSADDEEIAALCELYRAACEREVECGVYIFSRAEDVDRCMAELDCAGVANAAVANGLAVSLDRAASCARAISSGTCEELQPWQGDIPLSIVTVREDCASVLDGTRERGDACARSEQCAAGLTCQGETCPGSCEPVPVTCTPFSCGADAYCDSSGVCVARGDLGATCGISNHENVCAEGGYCSYPPLELDGTCVAQHPRGAGCVGGLIDPCAGPEVCRDGTCQDPVPDGGSCDSFEVCESAFCDLAIHQCAQPRALGAACENFWNSCGPAAECADGICRAFDRSVEPGPISTRPIVGVGASCRDANCADGLACRPSGDAVMPTWTCAPAFALGASCRPSNPDLELALLLEGVRGVAACTEGVCDVFGSWTCVAQRQPGESCSSPGLTAECSSLICSDGTCSELYGCP